MGGGSLPCLDVPIRVGVDSLSVTTTGGADEVAGLSSQKPVQYSMKGRHHCIVFWRHVWIITIYIRAYNKTA